MRLFLYTVLVSAALFSVYVVVLTLTYTPVKTNAVPNLGAEEKPTIRSQLDGKAAAEKAEIKSTEIAKIDTVGTFTETKYGYQIEFEQVTKIDGGVELFARAWKNGKPVGLGVDGTTEWERFRIFNPPIMVEDGTCTDTWSAETESFWCAPNYKEDPEAALQTVIAHNIKLTGKEDATVKSGSRGNTTSTFYPDPNPESTSVDGSCQEASIHTSWASIHDLTACDGSDDLDTNIPVRARATATSNNFDRLYRGYFLFDTSAITDTDVVSSATLSLKGQNTEIDTAGTAQVAIVASTPASNTAIATGDFDQVGTTQLATNMTVTAWSASAYNDFALNASGVAAITATGVSKFGLRFEKDRANDSTWSSGLDMYVEVSPAETALTTSDPKLVVVHAAAAAGSTPNIQFTTFE